MSEEIGNVGLPEDEYGFKKHSEETAQVKLTYKY